jgi:hypothetical protein
LQVNYPYFLKIWKHFFPTLTLRKYVRFAKCDECADLRSQFSHTYDGPQRQHLKEEFKTHLQTVLKERALYADYQRSAKNGMDDILSMCIDGTDQLPFGVPQFAQRLKNHGVNGVRLHLVIVVVHNLNTYCYMVPQCFHSDSNLTVEVLQQTLKSVEARMHQKLPGVLHLRADNCWRENKNRFVLAYLADLVQRGVFREIYFDFLVKGHTHIDADQRAACFKMAVQNRDIMSRSAFVKRLEASHAPSPSIVRITGVMNWSKLCNTVGACADLKDHTVPRRFVFTKEGGLAVIRFAPSALHQTNPVIYYPFGKELDRCLDLDELQPAPKKPVPPNDLKVIKDFFVTLQGNATFKKDPVAAAEYEEEVFILEAPDLDPDAKWWTDGGRFVSEMKNLGVNAGADVDMMVPEEDLKMAGYDCLPQQAGVSRGTIHRVQDNSIAAGMFLILKAPPNDPNWKQRFWVARVRSVRHSSKWTDGPTGQIDFKVRVVYYHSPAGEYGSYKEFMVVPSEQEVLSDLSQSDDSDDMPLFAEPHVVAQHRARKKAKLQPLRAVGKGKNRRLPMVGDVCKSNIIIIFEELNHNGTIPARYKQVIEANERITQGWTSNWATAGADNSEL